MSRHLLLGVVAAAVLCCGCSHNVWTTSRHISPTTYSLREIPISRSVGRLRRLALMPVSFRLERGGSADPSDESEELRLRQDIAEVARRFLVDWRGYEVVVVEDYVPDQLACMLEWASVSENDAVPPVQVTRVVGDLARRHQVDGVMLIQGQLRMLSDLGFAVILGTAGLAWPIVLPADSGGELRVDLFESDSGRIVWRSRGEDWVGDATLNFSLEVENLLDPLEHAVPRSMVGDTGDRP